MKKFALILSTALTFTNASEDIFNKVLTFHKILFAGGIDFNVTQSKKEKYKLTIIPKVSPYTNIFKHQPTIHLKVDKGPFISIPKFTLAKVGFEAKEDFFTLINKKNPKGLQKKVSFTIAGIVNFSDKLQETITLDTIDIEDNKSLFFISPIEFKSEINLNNYTGWAQIYLNSIKLKGKKDNSLLSIDNIVSKNEYLSSPIENLYLFSKNHTQIKKLHLLTKDKYHLNINTSIAIKSLDKNTTYFAKGIKELTYEMKLNNLGTKGVIEFIKLTRKMQEAQENLAKASKKNDDIALQKAILQISEVNNEMVPIFNQTIIPNKTQIVINLILQESKQNHIKLNLVYKGPKVRGSLQSAYITLLAQNLALFDGDFDFAISRDLAFNLYPFSTLFLDLLKSKGLAKEKNGIYELKGKLQNGKIIINNHAYSLQELNMLLFKGL